MVNCVYLKWAIPLIVCLLVGCAPDSEAPGETGGAVLAGKTGANARQLNLTILLDLSDRVEPSKYPSSPAHHERDVEAVAALVDAFREDMKAKGAFAAKSKIRTIFSPNPDSPNINSIAERLTVDLESMLPPEKKVVFDSLVIWYRTYLPEIYQEVLASKKYPGADIWRFFKDGQVQDYAINPDPNYRNVLVIVTDGYIYHNASKDRQGNRTAFVTGPYLQQAGLRSSDWRQKFDSGDFGFLTTGRTFDNLEVLVLEVNPSSGHPNDFDVLQAYWGDWLGGMGISKYRLVKSDLPVHSQRVIRSFIGY